MLHTSDFIWKNEWEKCSKTLSKLSLHPSSPSLPESTLVSDSCTCSSFPSWPACVAQAVLAADADKGSRGKEKGQSYPGAALLCMGPLPLATEVPDRHLPCPAGLGAIFQWPSPLKPPRWSVVSGCAGASRRLLSWQCNSKSWAYVSNCPEQDRNWWEPNSSFSGFVVTLTHHLLCRNKSTKYNYFENETFLDVEKRSNSREEKDRKRRTREIRLRQWLT